MDWALRIDGTDMTGDCSRVAVATPNVVYETTVGGEAWAHHAIGPRGFMVTMTRPTERLRRLLADGAPHSFAVGVDGFDITAQASLQRDCTSSDGPKLICCLPASGDRPQWTVARQDQTVQQGGQ